MGDLTSDCVTNRNIWLLVMLAVLLFMHLLAIIVSRTCFGKPMEQHDSSALRVIPSSSPTTPASVGQPVSAPPGLSCLLLQVAAGVSGSIFGEAKDFVIESALGSGGFGIVVKVRRA